MVQGRCYQSLLGTYSVFSLRPVGRCEGIIQLQKEHCDSAWPIAANAAIRAYLHPNEVGLSWARHTWQLRWRKLHASCTADPSTLVRIRELAADKRESSRQICLLLQLIA